MYLESFREVYKRGGDFLEAECAVAAFAVEVRVHVLDGASVLSLADFILD